MVVTYANKIVSIFYSVKETYLLNINKEIPYLIDREEWSRVSLYLRPGKDSASFELKRRHRE